MKSDEIIAKIRNKIQECDPQKRTVTNIFQFIFTDSDGKCIKKMGIVNILSTLIVAKKLPQVFDFKDLNIYEGTCPASEAEITISDDDFYLIGTHQASFNELIANVSMCFMAEENVNLINVNYQKKAHAQGDTDAIDKMMEKFRMNQK